MSSCGHDYKSGQHGATYGQTRSLLFHLGCVRVSSVVIERLTVVVSHKGRRRRRYSNALRRPVMFLGISGVLVVGTLAITSAPVGAKTLAGATTTAPAKSESNARLHSTGYGGLKGGHASGRAVGRATVARTSAPPTLTPGDLAIQRRAAQMPTLGPAAAENSEPPAG